MSNLTKEALRYEMWAMLPDDCKQIMENIKESYLDSMMADTESYANGKMLDFLKERYGCNGIVSIEKTVDGEYLQVQFKTGRPLTFENFSEIIEFINSESASND